MSTLNLHSEMLSNQGKQLNDVITSINYVVQPSITSVAGSVIFYLLSAASSGTSGVGALAADDNAAAAAAAVTPVPMCCGFFVSPTVALTVSHNVRSRCLSESNTIAGRSLSGVDLSFSIVSEDTALDFMVLRVSARTDTDHFKVTSRDSCSPLLGAQRVALLACGIAMADETREGTSEQLRLSQLPLSLTTLPASITHVGTRHFSYDASTYDGDSGGCLFFGTDSTVIGLHLEGINRAKELLEQEESLAGLVSPSSGSDTGAAGPNLGDQRPAKRPRKLPDEVSSMKDELSSVKDSIRDIISSVKIGGLALFLGASEVRAALQAAGVALPGAGV